MNFFLIWIIASVALSAIIASASIRCHGGPHHRSIDEASAKMTKTNKQSK